MFTLTFRFHFLTARCNQGKLAEKSLSYWFFFLLDYKRKTKLQCTTLNLQFKEQNFRSTCFLTTNYDVTDQWGCLFLKQTQVCGRSGEEGLRRSLSALSKAVLVTTFLRKDYAFNTTSSRNRASARTHSAPALGHLTGSGLKTVGFTQSSGPGGKCSLFIQHQQKAETGLLQAPALFTLSCFVFQRNWVVCLTSTWLIHQKAAGKTPFVFQWALCDPCFTCFSCL